MSEANILNPAADSLLNPDYAYTEGQPQTRHVFQAASGKIYSRRFLGRGRIFELTWNRRPLATKHTLQQWAQEYENDFFTLVDWEATRYYSGRFESPLVFTPESNEAWTVRGRFEELPGLALNTYPVDWDRDAAFLEERDGFGDDLIKQTAGTWTYGANANAHGGAEFTYPNADTTGKAEWVYFGYGVRIWARKQNNLGIFNARVTRLADGSVMAGPTAVDQYNSSALAAAALFTKADLPLDFYRVALEATNTKNASSSAKTITADALEVMR